MAKLEIPGTQTANFKRTENVIEFNIQVTNWIRLARWAQKEGGLEIAWWGWPVILWNQLRLWITSF